MIVSVLDTVQTAFLSSLLTIRCLLLADREGELCGVRLGSGRRPGEQLIVSEIVSESVQEVCQIRKGDIVTHVNGAPVGASFLPARGARRRLPVDEEGDAGLTQGWPMTCPSTQAWGRAFSPGFEGEHQVPPHPSALPGRPKFRNCSPSVVELRLIRANSLPTTPPFSSSPFPPPSFPSSPASSSLLRPELPIFYYETHPRDSLESIALLFQTTPEVIRRDNRGYFRAGERAEGTVPPGLLLKIRNPSFLGGNGPGTEEKGREEEEEEADGAEGEVGVLVQSREGSPVLASGDLRSDSPSSPLSLPTSPRTSCQSRYWEVGAGESVSDLARRLKVGVLELRRWNRHLFPTGEPVKSLPPGTLVRIFAAGHEGWRGGGR